MCILEQKYPVNQSRFAMATTPQKDAIVFILDVNPSLWETKSTANSGKLDGNLT